MIPAIYLFIYFVLFYFSSSSFSAGCIVPQGILFFISGMIFLTLPISID